MQGRKNEREVIADGMSGQGALSLCLVTFFVHALDELLLLLLLVA